MTTTQTEWWPYGSDADRDDPLMQHRIPVTSSHPHWRYVMTFDRASEVRPTPAEISMLVSYLTEITERYTCYPKTQAFDTDSGANTIIFHKHAEDDWSFRRASWEHGFRPQRPQTTAARTGAAMSIPYSLEQIMDQSHGYEQKDGTYYVPPSWITWKNNHPNIFLSITKIQSKTVIVMVTNEGSGIPFAFALQAQHTNEKQNFKNDWNAAKNALLDERENSDYDPEEGPMSAALVARIEADFGWSTKPFTNIVEVNADE